MINAQGNTTNDGNGQPDNDRDYFSRGYWLEPEEVRAGLR
jgi:hypothetical protein